MHAVEPTTFSTIVRSYPFRLGLYGVAAVVVYQAVYFGVTEHGTDYMGRENGPLEAAQATLALLASLCLFYAASRITFGKAGLIACASLMGYAAARESDTLFEALFFDDAYKWLVGLPLFAFSVRVVLIQRRTLVSQTMWLMRHPAATLFAIAGFYLCGVCQVLDRPDLWTNISSAREATTTKAFIEEFAELFAYLLLSFSAFEAVLLSRRSTTEAAADRTEPIVRLAA